MPYFLRFYLTFGELGEDFGVGSLSERILSSFKALNIKEYKKQEEQGIFSQPSYTKNIRANVAPLTIAIPDGFEYVTEKHIPQNDHKAVSVLKDYTMVAAPTDCKGGLRNYRDAALGINISEPQQVGLSEDSWKDISAIKKSLHSNSQGRKLKYLKEGANYLIGYGKGNECEEGENPYWITYFAVILCGSLQYTVNLYFNSKKASYSKYIKAVETFCANILVNGDELEEAEVNHLREELGDMLADNGRLDGILASQLYTKDVIFNNDDEVTYDGTHTIISGFQLNAAVMDNYPRIMNHAKAVVQELKRVITFVEQNENLMIPKSKFHPNILKATRNNPITGATIFELCAWHMLLIAESDKNKYTVAIDSNLIKGIPDAYTYVGEFIKTLRAYNEIYDDFEVTYVSTLNADGPCGNISSPVRGAVTDSPSTITVIGGRKDVFDNYAAKLKELDSVSDADYAKDEIERLEKKVDAGVIDGLKAEVKDAKVLLNKISAAIKAKNYKGLSSIDEVIEKVNEAIDETVDITEFNLSYTYRPFVNSYELVYSVKKVVSDAKFGGQIGMVLSENTFQSGTFDPDDFPKSLSVQIDNLTYEDIYKQFLESVNYLISKGNQVISKISAKYIQKKLEEWGNDFEVQGTQYEGRIERIESVNVGNKLTLKRETDNKYDSNAIDLMTTSGSVGHLPAKVAKLLSPAIDAGTVKTVAEVIKVEPLSQRSKRAKKPLLNVKIIIHSNDNPDPKKGKKAEETKKNSKKKKHLEDETRKKPKEEAKAKKREQAETGAFDLVKEARESYKKLEKTWQDRLDAHQDRISLKVCTSMDEVTRDMRRIVLDRNSFGTKYDDLIKDIDDRGKKYIKDGCSYIAVRGIRDIITEIIDKSSALDIDFCTTGMSTAKIGSRKFKVSQSSKSIQRWWNSKYENMPMLQAEKKRKKLLDDLRAAEKSVTVAKNELSNLDTKAKTLEQEISISEHTVKELEEGYDASKSRIESELADTLQGLKEKIDTLKADKAATEKNISDMQTQIASLSFFKFGLKKELTKKVNSAQAGIQKFSEDIRRVEADCEEAKRKCNSDIASLQQKIDDEKRTLSGKKSELTSLPAKKTELRTKVKAAINKVKNLKAEIAKL